MICPKCSSDDIVVVDSRPSLQDNGVRRRRICGTCLHKWSTYEFACDGKKLKKMLDAIEEMFKDWKKNEHTSE